jgi:hypothetical protein
VRGTFFVNHGTSPVMSLHVSVQCYCCDVSCHINWLFGKVTYGSRVHVIKSGLTAKQDSSHDVVLSGPTMPPSLTHEDCRALVCLICMNKKQNVRPISRPLQLLIDQLYLSGLGQTHFKKIICLKGAFACADLLGVHASCLRIIYHIMCDWSS